MSNILDAEQIKILKKCGKIMAATFKVVAASVKPGVSTFELDRIAESTLRQLGGEPAIKNYNVPGMGVYPSSICTSVNDEVVHGLPSRQKVLRQGDIISIDIVIKYQGMYSDASRTMAVGQISKEAQRLIETTKKCLDRAIATVGAGQKIGIIGKEVQEMAEKEGFAVVRELVGHGVGPGVHLSPQIPNFGNGSLGPTIVEGMALAIEPMLTAGQHRIKTLSDGWTIVTADGSLAAHFEDTVVIEGGKGLAVTR